MEEFEELSLRYKNGVLEVLDQRKLPDHEIWLPSNKPEDMFQYIKQLSVRGAPLIGIAAAMALAVYAKTSTATEDIVRVAEYLRSARPTAVNLMFAIDLMLSKNKGNYTYEALAQTAREILLKERAMCEAMSKHGAELVQDGDNIMTICNTGGLATAGSGTALGVIKESFKQGKKIHVFVLETRPLLQGGRLTTWELKKANIPYTLVCDSMASAVIKRKGVNRIFVGADRITTRGDFANKIGTYNLAVVAKYHNVPFHCVAPISTVDFKLESGEDIEIEERIVDEVLGGPNGRWAPEGSKVFNPAFDVTPCELVTSIVLDIGVLSKEQLLQGNLKKFAPN